MNKPPLATNMHLCCRDGNHKHLYLLVNACTKTGVVEEEGEGEGEGGKEDEEEWGKQEERRRFHFSACVMKGYALRCAQLC